MNLTLIIPTYDRAHLLSLCIESILRAARPRGLCINVVVVDNNSSDDTKRVVNSFAGQPDICVQYLLVLRRGKSAALNQALCQVNAELVGLIDDDEEIDSAWFQVIHRELSADPGLDYIGGPCVPNWEQAQPDWFPSAYCGVVGIALRPERVPFSPEFNGMLMGGNAVIRNSTLQRVLPYPEHLGKIGNTIRSGEDEVIYHRLLEIGARGVVVPDMIIRHRIPAQRLTKRYFRRWVVGRGISVGSQMRDRGFEEPGLFGIPRYMFGAAVRGCGLMVSSRSPRERFTAQLSIFDCLATLYGRHQYRLSEHPETCDRGCYEAGAPAKQSRPTSTQCS